MASTLPKLPVFEAIASHDPSSIAVVHSLSGRKFTYGELLKDVAEAKNRLHMEAGNKSLDGERIAFLVENGYDYVGAQKIIYNQFKINSRSIDCSHCYSNSSINLGHQFDSSASIRYISCP